MCQIPLLLTNTTAILFSLVQIRYTCIWFCSMKSKETINQISATWICTIPFVTTLFHSIDCISILLSLKRHLILFLCCTRMNKFADLFGFKRYYSGFHFPCFEKDYMTLLRFSLYVLWKKLYEIVNVFLWQTNSVKVKNIAFMHIKGTSATEEAIIFACSDESPCEGLYLEDVELLSLDGWITTSLCWQAFGTTVGVVYPLPCFSDNDDNSFISQKIDSRFSAASAS